MGQGTRIAIYPALSGLLFISLFVLGEYRWIAFVGTGLVLLAASLERCPSCGGSLMTWGYKRIEKGGPLICRSCWQDGGHRPAGPADPAPPRR